MKLHAIMLAIYLCRPGIPEPARKAYAQEILRLPAAFRLHAVALVEHESKWSPTAISRDREDVGLGQVRARFLRGCRGDADPVNHPSASCRAERLRLLDGLYNLRLSVAQLLKWRSTCRRKTGKVPTPAQLLQAYGGYSRPRAGVWCGLKMAKHSSRSTRRGARARTTWQPTTIPRPVRDILTRERALRRQILATRL